MSFCIYDTQNFHKVNQKRFYKQVFNEKLFYCKCNMFPEVLVAELTQNFKNKIYIIFLVYFNLNI